MIKYTTIDDVINYAVAPALGEYVDDFDTGAIANEAFDYVTDIDEDGVQHGNGYFVQREDVDFWEIAEKHDHGEQLDMMTSGAWDGEGTYAITEPDGDITEVECDDMGDLKAELCEIYSYSGDWSAKIAITKADINIEFNSFRGECDINGISGLLNDCMGAEEIAEAITSNLAKDFDEEAMKGIAAEAIEKMGVDVDGNEAAEQIHICLMAGRMAALGA